MTLIFIGKRTCSASSILVSMDAFNGYMGIFIILAVVSEETQCPFGPARARIPIYLGVTFTRRY